MSLNPNESPAGLTGVPTPSAETAPIAAFSKTYAVTPSMLLSSNSQYFFAVALGWRWLGCVFILAYSMLCLLLNFPTIAAIAFAIAALMTTMWVKAYFQYRDMALAQVQLFGNMQVTIELSESGIRTSSARGNVAFAWSELNRIKQSRDFGYIMRDKLPLMSLPKSELTADAIALLNSRVG